MEVKKPVNLVFEGGWVRSRMVDVRDGHVHCILACERPYSLLESYPRTAHLEFLGCKGDDDLLRFLHRWGPLRLTQFEFSAGLSVRPLQEYRAYQTWLAAFVRLLGAYRNSDQERLRLHEFLEADKSKPRYSKVNGQESVCCVSSGEISIEALDAKSVRGITSVFISAVPLIESAGLACSRESGRPVIEAHFKLTDLQSALEWMVWFDEYRKNPLQFCAECDKPFKATSAHAKKYCTDECAHRVAARNYARRKRKNSNVAKKAR